MSIILTNQLSIAYGKTEIIKNLDLSIIKGKITILIGSNGCGKSTILRTIARLLKPSEGNIIIDGKDIVQTCTKELAKKMSVLPQSQSIPEGMTIFQLVKQGRYPHQSLFQQWTVADEKIVDQALKSSGLTELKHNRIDQLSGGQRQRAWIAMILAQETDLILLDEPTTYLDIAHQIEVLDLLFLLNQKKKNTIVMVLHDLNLAARYADMLIAIADKNIYVQGTPDEVITEEHIQNIFNISSTIIHDPIFKTPLCIPHSHICKYGTLL